MRFLKKVTSIICAAALCIQASSAVFAEQMGVHTDSGVAVASVDAEDSCLSYLKDVAVNDDPSYIKFVRNQQQVGLTDFSSLVTHQAKFSSFNKIYGIDVSQFNGEIDFTKVKAEGYQFVIIRVGARGYGQSGVMITDTDFEKNIDNAKKAGLMVGVYFYTQAITKAEVKEEADFCLKKLAGRKLDLPVYFDIEPAYDWNGLPGRLVAANFTMTQKAQLCAYFCELIKAGGYEGGITSCKSWFDCEIDMSVLETKYDIWLAHYTTSTNYDSDYNMWQFASTRKINGVQSSMTDQDVRYINTVMPSGYIKLAAVGQSNTVKLSWNAIANVAGYNVYKKDSAGKVQKIAATSALTYTAPRDDNDAQYYIQGYNIVNSQYYYSSNSNSVSISGGKVANVSATCVTETSVSLSWKAVTGATGYIICVKRGNDAIKYYGYTNSLNYTVSGLTKDTQYTFRVVAFYNPSTLTTKEYKSGVSVLGKAANDLVTYTVRNVPVTTTAIKGKDRYATAAMISAKAFPKGSSIAIVASGERYADALVSAPMAKSFGAPVLLTEKRSVSQYTLDELARLGAKTVYVVGGYDVVTAAVDSTLQAKGITVRRVYSSYTNDDFGTAVYVSANMDIARGKNPEEVFISTVEGYADMLSVASIAAARNAPVLYISKSGVLDGATKYYLNGLKGSLKTIYIIGGSGAVGSNADSILKEYANSVVRIKGSNRYETCIKVNTYFSSTLTGKSICVTTGQNYPDALAGGVFAAINKAPMLIADGSVSSTQKQYLLSKSPTTIYTLGGKGIDAEALKAAINGR